MKLSFISVTSVTNASTIEALFSYQILQLNYVRRRENVHLPMKHIAKVLDLHPMMLTTTSSLYVCLIPFALNLNRHGMKCSRRWPIFTDIWKRSACHHWGHGKVH